MKPASTIFILMLYFATVQAQWYGHPPPDLSYDPPNGWTYVNGSFGDSIGVIGARARGGILDLLMYDYKTTPYHQTFRLVSTDRGQSWDTTEFKDYGVNVACSLSNKIYYFTMDSTGGRTIVFPDLYKRDSIIYPFSSQVVNYIRSYGYFECAGNLLDENDIFLKTSYTAGGRTVMGCLRSRDGGKTWLPQDLPRPSDFGSEFSFELVFNVRNPNRWLVCVSGFVASRLEYVDRLFETADNGLTFHEDTSSYWDITKVAIIEYPNRYGFFGIGSETERRGFFSNYNFSKRFWYSYSTVTGNRDLSRDLYGVKADSLSKIIDFRIISVGRQDLFIFDLRQPHTQFVATMFTDSHYREGDLFVTTDNEVTWKSILHTKRTCIEYASLDVVSHDLLIVMPENEIGARNPKQHVWIKENATSIDIVRPSSSSVLLYPHPVSNLLNVSLPDSILEPVIVSLYDILGNKLFDISEINNDSMRGRYQCFIPGSVANGLYCVTIQTKNIKFCKMIQIIR